MNKEDFKIKLLIRIKIEKLHKIGSKEITINMQIEWQKKVLMKN
jgi:hypothetical protein